MNVGQKECKKEVSKLLLNRVQLVRISTGSQFRGSNVRSR